MGEVPQCYVTGAHEAIISPAVWDFVQARQRHEELIQQHGSLLEQIRSKNNRQAVYHDYKQDLSQLDAQTLEFSPYLCVTLLDSITVTNMSAFNVSFRGNRV